MIRLIPALALVLSPLAAHAAGSGSTSAPEPTPTTTQCAEGQVYDDAKKECVAPKDSLLDDDKLYDAVRELAYAGRYRGASEALDAMAEQRSDRVLTYRGFIARRTGDAASAMAFYAEALRLDPDNLLARSYMGQGFVEAKRLDLARAQLAEIRVRNGSGTWAEASLKQAILSGQTYDF